MGSNFSSGRHCRAILGFGGIAGTATSIAMTLFWLFLAITVIFFVIGLIGGGSRRNI